MTKEMLTVKEFIEKYKDIPKGRVRTLIAYRNDPSHRFYAIRDAITSDGWHLKIDVKKFFEIHDSLNIKSQKRIHSNL